MLLDIIFIIIMLISILSHYRRGIINSIFSVSTSLLTIIALFVFYKPVSALFKASEYGTDLFKSTNEYISSLIVDYSNNAINTGDLPEFIKNLLSSGTQNLTEAVIPITEKIIDLGIGVVVFIVLFIIIKLILKLIPSLLNFITKLPLIKQTNKLLGGIAGIIIGLIWCVLIIYAVGLLSINPSFGILNEQIKQSSIISYFYTAGFSDVLF